MSHRRNALLALFSGASLVAAMSASPWLQDNTWTLRCGDPGRRGEHTTTLTMSYTDSSGVKQEKAVSASVSLTSADTNDSTKKKAENALDAELAKPENLVGGQPLASTGGVGSVLVIAPDPSVTDAKIKSLETEDHEASEDDLIGKPRKKAVARINPEGELIGETSDRGPSAFFVTTNLGTASVELSGSMSKHDLLEALEGGLLAQDPALEAWVDSELEILFVLLDATEGIIEIGAGSTDQGLAASCKVQLIE